MLTKSQRLHFHGLGDIMPFGSLLKKALDVSKGNLISDIQESFIALWHFVDESKLQRIASPIINIRGEERQVIPAFQYGLHSTPVVTGDIRNADEHQVLFSL